jgi:hypothetical protein
MENAQRLAGKDITAGHEINVDITEHLGTL